MRPPPLSTVFRITFAPKFENVWVMNSLDKFGHSGLRAAFRSSALLSEMAHALLFEMLRPRDPLVRINNIVKNIILQYFNKAIINTLHICLSQGKW